MSNRVPESLRIANVSRRSLLLGMGAGSLVLAIGLPRPGRAQDAPVQFGADAMPKRLA